MRQPFNDLVIDCDDVATIMMKGYKIVIPQSGGDEGALPDAKLIIRRRHRRDIVVQIADQRVDIQDNAFRRVAMASLAALQRLTDLRQKKRAADNAGQPLTHQQEATFRFLALLYPSKPRPSQREEILAEHSFQNLPISEGKPSPPEGQNNQAAGIADDYLACFGL